MPTYEYQCQKCGHSFSLKMSMSEHDRGGVACPDCGSASVTQRYSQFYARTCKKS